MDQESPNKIYASIFWHQDKPQPLNPETWLQNHRLSLPIDPLAVLNSISHRDSIIKILDAAPYPNGPLNHGEIRILTLHPGTWSSPIVCTLENINLKKATIENGGFCALSYTWGPPTQPRYAIWINGAAMTVGEQLFEALAHSRDSREARRLWIDAICIRQDSNEEKSTQLPLMTDIYSCASDVCIWLGPDQDDSGYALAAVRDAAQRAAKVDDAALPPIRLAKALTAILRRQWFSRLWIIQELALASHNLGPRVVTGFEEARWSQLNSMLNSARHTSEQSSEKENPAYADFLKCMDDSPLVGLNTTRLHVQECGSLPLQLALRLTQFAQATDPRDKIYGLLGLLDDVGRQDLAPNYSKHMGEVFKDATATVLGRHGDKLRYLTYPTLPWSPSGNTSSWVWDLSFSPRHYAFGMSGTLVGGDINQRDPGLSIDGNLLTTSGTIVDVMVEAHRYSDPPASFLAEILKVHRRAKVAASWWADGIGDIDPPWRSLRGEGNNNPPAKKAAGIRPMPEEVELMGIYTLFSASANSEIKTRPTLSELETWYREEGEPLFEALDHALKALVPGSGKKPCFFSTENGLCGWCPEELVLTSRDYKIVVAVLFRGSATEIAFALRQHNDGMYTIISPVTLPKNWARLNEAKGNLPPRDIIIK